MRAGNRTTIAGRLNSMMKNASSLHRGRYTPTQLALAIAIATSLVIASCGDGAGEQGDASSDREDRPSAEANAEVECGSSRFDMNAYADAPLATSLPAGPAGATNDLAAPAFDPSLAWRVVHQSSERVELLRELDEPLEMGGGDVRTHEARVVAQITGASNVPDGAWLLTSAGPCTPRLVNDGDLGQADLALAEPPSPGATEIELLVQERACASGTPATGRIEVIELRETPEEVSIRIGVRSRAGGSTCPGNPQTPFVVELSEPLADRTLVDASIVPARPVTVDREE
jgi:hypothetical protein